MSDQFIEPESDAMGFDPSKFKAPEPSGGEFEKRLEAHDTVVKNVWNNFFRPKREQSLSAEEELLENKLRKVLSIGTKLGIRANGLSGYHTPVITNESESREQNARRNMVNIITEGNIKPAEGYSSDLNPFIDKDGNLLDANETQAYSAPIRVGSYYDSSGNFGPYWVILEHDTTAMDRSKGIPASQHKYYLVPDEIDREFIAKQLQGSNPDALAKVKTYDEFVAIYQKDLPEDWWEDREKAIDAKDQVYEVYRAFEDELKQVPEWEQALDRALSKIVDRSADPQFRLHLVNRLPTFASFMGSKTTDREVLSRARETLLSIVRDPESPDQLRKQCLNNFRMNEELFSRDDVELLYTMAQDKNNPQDWRFAVMDIIKGCKSYPDRVEILSKIALDPEESVPIKHQALFQLPTNDVESVITFKEFIRHGTEQGKKIAMHSLAVAPLVDPGADVIQAVDELASQNSRADTQYYIDQFNKKFAYITHPEAFQDLIPQSWEEFLDRSEQLALDQNATNIQSRRQALLAYTVNALRNGEIRLTTATDGGFYKKDLILYLGHTNDIGIVTDEGESKQIGFPGGTTMFEYVRDSFSRNDPRMRKIVRNES